MTEPEPVDLLSPVHATPGDMPEIEDGIALCLWAAGTARWSFTSGCCGG